MTQDQHGTHLWWDGAHGVARHRGVSVVLTEAPNIGGLRVASLNFHPSVRVADLREVGVAQRKMTDAEKAETLALLSSVAAAAQEAISPSRPRAEPDEDSIAVAWADLTAAIGHLPERSILAARLHRAGIAQDAVADLLRRMREAADRMLAEVVEAAKP